MTTRWKDFDTSTAEDRARAAKASAPVAWAVVDKIGTVCKLAYTEDDALAMMVGMNADLRNRNMSGGYGTIGLVFANPKR